MINVPKRTVPNGTPRSENIMWNLILKYGIIVLAIIAVIVLGINLYVRLSTKKKIIKKDEYSNLSDVDCIIILGAAIWGDKPSPMLEDRLLEGIKLYQNNVSDKIIMSGDHGKKEYDEVNMMKNYAIEKGIPYRLCSRRTFRRKWNICR